MLFLTLCLVIFAFFSSVLLLVGDLTSGGHFERFLDFLSSFVSSYPSDRVNDIPYIMERKGNENVDWHTLASRVATLRKLGRKDVLIYPDTCPMSPTTAFLCIMRLWCVLNLNYFSDILHEVSIDSLESLEPYLHAALEECLSTAFLTPPNLPDAADVTKLQRALDACMIALNIMTSTQISRKLLKEDMLEKIVHIQTNHCIHMEMRLFEIVLFCPVYVHT